MGTLMFGKLLNLLVAAIMLAALGWHYRDTDTVRQRRPLIESVLSKVGVSVETVRHYWPLDGANSKGLPGASAAWADAMAQYNPITKIRAQLDAADQAQRQREQALARSSGQ